MAHAILVFKSYRKEQAVQLIAHNMRTDERSRENVDESRTAWNEISGYTDGDVLVASEQDCPTHQPNGRKIRWDAVHFGSYILSASPEYFEGTHGNWNWDKVAAWKAATEKFIRALPGRTVHVSWHFDEKTPHCHVLQLAVNEHGKLSKREVFGGKTKQDAADRLRKFQDDYASALAPLGLERGVRGSTRSYAPRATKMHEEAINKAAREQMPKGWDKAIWEEIMPPADTPEHADWRRRRQEQVDRENAASKPPVDQFFNHQQQLRELEQASLVELKAERKLRKKAEVERDGALARVAKLEEEIRTQQVQDENAELVESKTKSKQQRGFSRKNPPPRGAGIGG